MINCIITRKHIAVAQLFAGIGVLLPVCIHPTTHLWLYTLHAICGMLVGISIAVSFTALKQKRRGSRSPL